MSTATSPQPDLKGQRPHLLTTADLAVFARMGIPVELLAQAHVQRVTDCEAREIYGITGPVTKDMSGIVFPYYSPLNGKRVTARVRRDNPEIEDRQEKNKYIAAYGDRKHLYFPPGAAEKLRDPDTVIVLVEGEKSVLSMTAWAERTGTNTLAVGLGGCWGWRGRIGRVENSRGERVDETGPISDLGCCDGRLMFVMLDANVATNPKVRQAQTALVAELRKRDCEIRLCSLPAIDGINGPDDYIRSCGDEAMAEVLDTAHAAEDRPPEFTDDGLALRFTERHGIDLRYTAVWGRWNVWDGALWKRDETWYVMHLARQVCRDASAECESKLAPRIASAATVAAVERLARADRHHAATVDQWDSNLWLLNTPAGIVDLATGALRPALREDYCTKITAVAPNDGRCPLWIDFLCRITNGNAELQEFMQRVCGYLLTGITREHALFFLYGTGANGKTVFLNTISGLIGDYARAAPIEAFIASRNEHHPTDLAGLQGARLVTAAETEDGQCWAESKLKTLTGGDRIAARFMRQDYFEFSPQFKLVIAGNHRPGLRTVDEAMRRRFNLLPFTVTIPVRDRDAELAEKLRQEWGGILQWMIDGCLAWQAQGLNPPAIVNKATEDYLASEDALGRWLEECCIQERNLSASSMALYKNWREWCKKNGEHEESQKCFSQNLEARGFARERSAAMRGFKGLALKSDVSTSDSRPLTDGILLSPHKSELGFQ